MRIYEGSPRQDWEEVLRGIGAYLDERAMRGIAFLETDTGFIVQGTSVTGTTGSGESLGRSERETMNLDDEAVGAFIDAGEARRGHAAEETQPKRYESELRVIGRYLDGQHPRDVLFMELDGAYILRLSTPGQGGLRQELVEFTRADIADMIARAPTLRRPVDPKAKPA